MIGDLGYRGMRRVATAVPGGPPGYNHLLYSARAMIEQYNEKLGEWGCFQEAWRHSWTLHMELTRVLANITNMKIELDPIRHAGPNPNLFYNLG